VTISMADSTNAADLPAGQNAYAGYVGGKWPTYNAVVTEHPGVPVLAIAVTASEAADCLDIESGDAVNAQAPGWVMGNPNAAKPCLYTSVSNAASLLGVLATAGIARTSIRLWTAHYTGVAHICSPACGFGMPTTADGTQWIDHGTWDQSLLNDNFFSTPGPAPVVIGGSTMDCDVPDGGVLACRSDGGVFAWEGANYYGSLPALGVTPSAPIVGIASTPTSQGYWLVGSDGMVYCFGDAQYYGPLPKYAFEWTIIGKVTGIVRGNAAGTAYTVVADLGGSAPSLYGIPTSGQYRT
jgi:hypothetical protein